MSAPRRSTLLLWQAALLLGLFGFWWAMTQPGLLPNVLFDNDQQAAFFFGQPLKVLARVWAWFVTDADIYRHLAVTLTETVLAFALGASLGLAGGLWLALAPLADVDGLRQVAARLHGMLQLELEVAGGGGGGDGGR